ncbi:MAG: hypothetical protein UHO61_02750 [Acutalibacteraceae bacterium]|nr:hypothetical protein [Acutalibacteraceae bacterium]
MAVGNDSVWTEMVANDRKTLRYTMLKEFLKENSAYESFNKPY